MDAVQTALNWDLSNPMTFLIQRKGMSPDYVQEMAKEYRRYIGIIAANPHLKFPVSEAVDEMWHTHILFTKDYRHMGDEVCGQYIGHYPVMSQEERISLLPDYVEQTLGQYEALYGEKPPGKWWPNDGAICFSCSGW